MPSETTNNTHWTQAQVDRLTELLEMQERGEAIVGYYNSDAHGYSANGGNTSTIARSGAIHEIEGPLKLCGPGALHINTEPHKWLGCRVWIAALVGLFSKGGDKYGGLKREIVGEVLPTECIFDSRLALRLRAWRFGANLRYADLRRANLWRADLWCADLRGADLRGADLRGAYLQDADLQGANLRSAVLQDAILQSADLRRAKLQDADLQGADLRRANLWYAGLQCADLRGANLLGAGLWRANLWYAHREESDPAIAEWRVVDGRLEK